MGAIELPDPDDRVCSPTPNKTPAHEFPLESLLSRRPTFQLGAESLTESKETMQKAALRVEMKRRLVRESLRNALAAGQAIADRLGATAEWARAHAVAAFSSLPDEVDTLPLVERARNEAKQILYPRIRPRGELEFARVETDAQLVDGPFGIREPASACPLVSLADSVLVLVPGLAFDRMGGRLGRGAGYYDRALASFAESSRSGCRIGVAYAFQLVDRVPMTSLDVSVDGVVTEVEFVLVGGECAKNTDLSS